MTLEQLHCFLVLAEELNFSRAAEKLHMGQPTLSRTIKVLEEELGVSLFVRSTRFVRLTEAGKILVEEGQKIETTVANAVQRLILAGKSVKKSLRVVSVNLNSPSIFEAIRTFVSENELDLSISHTYSDIALRKVLQKEADFGLALSVDLVGDLGPLNRLYLCGGSFSVYLSQEHPLAQKETITLADICQEKIMVSDHQKFAFLREWLVESGVPQNRISLINSSADATLHLQINGDRIAVLPSVIGDLGGKGCAVRKLEGSECGYDIVAFWRKDNQNQLVHFMAEYLKEQLM